MIHISRMLLIMIIIPSLIFSQEKGDDINILSVKSIDIPLPESSVIESIFENFQSNIVFLDNKISEIEQLMLEAEDLYRNDFTEEGNFKTKQNYIQLYNSFQVFTDFNSKRLIEIKKRLINKQPLQGCEIIYLNKSFYVFKKYIELNDLIRENINKTLKDNQKKIIPINLLHIQLSQLNFFYKNYFESIDNKQIRRILNTDDSAYKIEKNDLKKIVLRQLRRKNFKLIQKTIFNSLIYPKNDLFIDTVLYKIIKNNRYGSSSIKRDKRNIRRFFNKDKAHNVGRTITHHLSGFTGNILGFFRFRKGYLHKNDSIYNEINNQLQPMDIIAEKTRFSLTDKFIPGHFGHIAIWLGTQKQLQESNLWSHPSIVPFHKQISEGFNIIEADRKGTHLKKLKDYLNVDEIAVIRIKNFKNLPHQYKTVIYENTMAQIGKKYDFNFDIETSNKLICSELLYDIFGPIRWPSNRYYNRSTITPDNIVSLVFYKKSPIFLSYYVSATNKTNILRKSLTDLANDLGYQKKDNVFIFVNKKCEKEKNRMKKKCTLANRALEYY